MYIFHENTSHVSGKFDDRENCESGCQEPTSFTVLSLMQRLLRIHLRGSSSSRIQRGRSPLTFSTLSASSSNLVPTHFLHRRGFTCQNRAYLCFSFRPLPRKLLVFSAAAVLPLLTERRDDEEDDTKELTLEQSLLETSEEERRERKHGNKDWPMLYRFFNRLKVAFLQYVYETIATSLRFIQLVVIFVPVLATVPVIFVGSRDPRHDNERSGTLWWYWFLVGQMERAGPTFIKVRFSMSCLSNFSWDNGQRLEQIYFLLRCVSICQSSTPMSTHTSFQKLREL